MQRDGVVGQARRREGEIRVRWDKRLRGEDGPVGVPAVAAGGDAAAGAGHEEGEVAEHHAAVAALHAGARGVGQRRRHAEQAATSERQGSIRNTTRLARMRPGETGDWRRRLLQVSRAAAALHAAVGGDRVRPVGHRQAGVRRERRERRGARCNSE